MFARCMLTLLLLNLLLLPWRPLAAQEQTPPPAQPSNVAGITVRGVEGLTLETREEIDRLGSAILGLPIIPEQIEEYRLSVQELGLFRRVTVRTEPAGADVQVILEVEANPVVQGVEFIGNTVLTDEELQAAIPVQPGEIVNENEVRASATAIQQAYAERGYTLVEVVDITFSEAGVLQFTILEVTISEIRIEGNTRTRESIIRQVLEVHPGQVYNINTIRQSLQNLQRLGVFGEVSAVPQPGIEPGTVILLIQVTEQRTGFVGLGGSYNQIGGFSGYLDFRENNLFGTAQHLTLLLQGGANDIYQLTYFNPIFYNPRTTLSATLFSRDLIHQAVFGEQRFEYFEQRTGGNVTLGRRLAPNTQGFATIRINNVDARPGDNPDVPEILLRESQVRSLALSAVRDTRLSDLYPAQGSYTVAGVEQAGLLGGADFTKLTGEARRYWVLRRRPPTAEGQERLPWVLATRLLGGSSFGEPPLLDQFLLGGANTLRGYPEDRFPGENLLLLNAELRVPFTNALQGVLFTDIGDAWSGEFADTFGDPTFDLHVGVGAGVRVQSPLGALRLDYAFNEDGESEFHFGIGPSF